MKNYFLILLFALAACQSTNIKNEKYKISPKAVELASIGQSSTVFNLKNDFKNKTLPELRNDIRLSVQVLPFDKKLYKIYSEKAKSDQNQLKITYSDSLSVKPEIVTIEMHDILGLMAELNSDYNKNTFRFLSDTKDCKIISGVVIYLPNEQLSKIKNADAFYLTHSQNQKYTISLFKSGKKTETIDISQNTVLAYKLSKFCWAADNKGNWRIADIIGDNEKCKGFTKSSISEKEKTKNLFKL